MSRRTHTLALAGLAALAAVGLSACGDVDGSAHSVAPAASTATTTTAPATPSATPSATPAPAPAPAPAAAAPVAPARAGTAPARNTGGTTGGGGTNTGGTNSGGGNDNGGGTSVSGPKIVSFSVSKPDCSAGNVTASWRVTGADGAALAVDNPGIYGAFGSDYPASGSQQLPFSCGSGTTKHTYTLWPAGAKSVSKTISVSAPSDSGPSDN
jgi:hypothetical protein